MSSENNMEMAPFADENPERPIGEDKHDLIHDSDDDANDDSKVNFYYDSNHYRQNQGALLF